MIASPPGWAAAPRTAGFLALMLTALTLMACGGQTSPDAWRSAAWSPQVSGSAVPSGPGTTTQSAASLVRGHRAWVAVSVATLWRTPSAPRSVDRPALAHPARIRQWLAAMTTAQRRGLGGRAETQALLGDRVLVVALRPHWAKVVVSDQPTPKDRRGYPGWVPRRQLSATAPAQGDGRATVTARTAWLRADATDGARLLEVSFGTRLPVLGRAGPDLRVALPGGAAARVALSTVSVPAAGAPALPATGRSLVRTAKQFVGLPYLWAGRSGFGFDCSGLTSLVYRVHGVRIPRDSVDQARRGQPVRAGQLRGGDLLFFARSGVVHHVAMYAGGGQMVHAPGTGQRVQVIPRKTSPYGVEYAGARRYLG